ncbi:hypothetical protein FI667_g14964, partial [Globisporangium splendens]
MEMATLSGIHPCWSVPVIAATAGSSASRCGWRRVHDGLKRRRVRFGRVRWLLGQRWDRQRRAASGWRRTGLRVVAKHEDAKQMERGHVHARRTFDDQDHVRLAAALVIEVLADERDHDVRDGKEHGAANAIPQEPEEEIEEPPVELRERQQRTEAAPQEADAPQAARTAKRTLGRRHVLEPGARHDEQQHRDTGADEPQ